jgi:hypothetical protein
MRLGNCSFRTLRMENNKSKMCTQRNNSEAFALLYLTGFHFVIANICSFLARSAKLTIFKQKHWYISVSSHVLLNRYIKAKIMRMVNDWASFVIVKRWIYMPNETQLSKLLLFTCLLNKIPYYEISWKSFQRFTNYYCRPTRQDTTKRRIFAEFITPKMAYIFRVRQTYSLSEMCRVPYCIVHITEIPSYT